MPAVLALPAVMIFLVSLVGPTIGGNVPLQASATCTEQVLLVESNVPEEALQVLRVEFGVTQLLMVLFPLLLVTT
jgi:hypothetical protein